MGLAQPWFDFDRASITFDRLFEPLSFRERDPEIVVSHGQAGMQPGGLAMRRDRFFELAQLTEGEPQVGMDRRDARFQFGGKPEACCSLSGPTCRAERIAEVVVDFRVARRKHRRPPIELDCFTELARLVKLPGRGRKKFGR